MELRHEIVKNGEIVAVFADMEDAYAYAASVSARVNSIGELWSPYTFTGNKND